MTRQGNGHQLHYLEPMDVDDPSQGQAEGEPPSESKDRTLLRLGPRRGTACASVCGHQDSQFTLTCVLQLQCTFSMATPPEQVSTV